MTAARPAATRSRGPAKTGRRSAAARPAGGGVAKVDLTTPDTAADLALPHERDEMVGSTGGVQSPLVQQGARDLKRGLKDTSRSVEANETYEKLKK